MMFLELTFILAVAFCATAAPAAEEELPGYGIVGGFQVDITSYPWQVSVGINGRHSCGGSIIAPNCVLTAAHCIQPKFASNLTVRAGTITHLGHLGGQHIKVKEAIVHPSYSTVNHDSDIAVLILEEDLEMGRSVQPIAVSKTKIPVGKMAAVSGWGALYEGGRSNAWLNAVSANVFEPELCKKIYGARLTENMFCAGHMSAGQDSCQGDSGGPLSYEKTLIGVVSWGFGCAREGLPGVYTYVSKYVPWIQKYADV